MLRALDFYVPSEPDDAPFGLRGIPVVNTEQGAAYVALRKIENNECVFLSDDICMIHQFRPGVCRSFPFVFEKKEGAITWGLSAMKEICPGLRTGPEITAEELKETSSMVLGELSIFREFAEEWNKNEVNPTAMSLVETILSESRFSP